MVLTSAQREMRVLPKRLLRAAGEPAGRVMSLN
jgi:hypothetical protein